MRKIDVDPDDWFAVVVDPEHACCMSVVYGLDGPGHDVAVCYARQSDRADDGRITSREWELA